MMATPRSCSGRPLMLLVLFTVIVISATKLHLHEAPIIMASARTLEEADLGPPQGTCTNPPGLQCPPTAVPNPPPSPPAQP
ncbi:hypothetical protein DAI22_12g071200 [Oryza sativa Japonica Group]|nr:hypothetical protein DAI22_12g071200 [Oryza sativa Japonica Group]